MGVEEIDIEIDIEMEDAAAAVAVVEERQLKMPQSVLFVESQPPAAHSKGTFSSHSSSSLWNAPRLAAAPRCW